jgi:hypothetical protein
VTAIHGEGGNGLIIHQLHLQDHDCTHSCQACFLFCATDTAVTFMLLWIFLHNLIDMLFLRYCELNCTSKGFSCNFLHLAVKQSPQAISCDIFDKRSQPQSMQVLT